MRTFALLMTAFACPSSASAATSPTFDNEFWSHWGDGHAELAGYDLVYNRYGENRKGVAVAVFVTETFSDAARVKADYRRPPNDQIPVLKLNLTQDYPTGIYDYNMMTSSFVQLGPRNGRPAGSPTKVSFSSQEWCGHVYHQLLFDTATIRETSHSYFDGEADRSGELPYPKNGLTADTLMLWARGLSGPALAAGETVTVPFLPSLERVRLDHRPLVWTTATLARSATRITVSVPAGTFEVHTMTARVANGLVYTFEVEASSPHRLVRWKTNRGDSGTLRGSKRLKYWELNGKDGERYLSEIGLSRDHTLPLATQ